MPVMDDRHKGWLPCWKSVFAYRRCLALTLVSLVVLLYWLSAQHDRPTVSVPHFVLRRPQAITGRYLVNTPACQIHNVDPFDVSVRKFIKPPAPVLCNKYPAPLTYSDMDSVYLLPERQHLYGARPPLTTVSCCTRDIYWSNDVVNFTIAERYAKVSWSTPCQNLVNSYTPSKADGVEVQCVLNGTTVYRDFYHFVPLRPRLEAASRRRGPQDVTLSVMIFMFDSLSRLQFLRWFPRSRRLLGERMEAFELGGFNKVGDNTWPNVVPLLTGMKAEKLQPACAPNLREDPLDGCPFMWRSFKRAGYRTALAEDSPAFGTFNYLRKGFVQQPTDYYTRPTNLLSDKYIAYRKNTNMYLCEGARNSYMFTFKYAQDLGLRMADLPYWAFIAQSTYTHDVFNMPYFLDEPYQQVLETLYSSGALNNTVLVTMGDHGLRWGAERLTFIGGMEERLPLMSLYFPRWLRRRYPAAFDNLRVNQNRLTTFLDVHRTLLDLLRPEETLGAADSRPAAQNASSVSLFTRVSPNRRCSDALVPEHYCTCLHPETIATDDRRALLAAAAVVRAVNEQLRAAPQCARLRLGRVLQARVAHQPSVKPPQANRYLHQVATVQLQTQPGGARLEATLLGDGADLTLSGSVSRLDRYGHKVWCVQDHHLERYCHCGAAGRPIPRRTAPSVGRAARPRDGTIGRRGVPSPSMPVGSGPSQSSAAGRDVPTAAWKPPRR